MIKDDNFQKFISVIQSSPEAHKSFQALNGLIFFIGKLFIPSTSPLKHVLLGKFHSSLIGGHYGIHRTFGRLSENLFWHGMRKDVIHFVKSCTVHQHTKLTNHLSYGLLQPLPVLDKLWEDISLNIITGTPSFQMNTMILVVVDRLSKMTHFGILPTNFTTANMADLFSKMVAKFHGMPRNMLTNRDPVFLSQFWQQFFRPSGTKLRMSIAYHPQSDGQMRKFQ